MAKEIIYLIEAPGRLSLKEPTVSFGFFRCWTFYNGPNPTEHQKGPGTLQRAGSTAPSEEFYWPFAGWAEYFVVVVVFKCNNFCMYVILSEKLNCFLPIQLIQPIAQEGIGIVSIKLYVIVKQGQGHI